MTLQTAVGYQQAFGVPGERGRDGPFRVHPGILIATADATTNVVGRATQVKAGATGSFPVAGDAGQNPRTLNVSCDKGAAGVFAGLIVNPKDYPSLGTTAGGTLAPTFTLPDNTVVQLATEGDWIVSLAAASNPGDVAYYNFNTGVITTAAPGAAIPANCAGPIGTIEDFVDAAASLALLHLEPRVPSLLP